MLSRRAHSSWDVEDFREKVFLVEIVNFSWFVGRGGEQDTGLESEHRRGPRWPWYPGQCPPSIQPTLPPLRRTER